MQLFTLPLLLLMSYNEWFLTTYEKQAIYPFNRTQIAPSEAGDARLTERLFDTEDGEQLVLWVSPPSPNSPTIYYLPGNAGNLATRIGRFSHFIDMGYGVVAIAYRGSSGSTGSPDEENLSQDSLQVFDVLDEILGVSTGGVIVYGESLGTGLATKIGANRDATAVILEAPFTSIPALAQVQYPNLDLTKILTQIWDNASQIPAVMEPLLILHGTEDKLVPIEHGRTIFRLAGSQDKWIEQLEGVGHNEIWTPDALNALYAFIDRH